MCTKYKIANVGDENRNMTVAELDEILSRVESNIETMHDYMLINFYLEKYGFDDDYFISQFNEKGIFTLDQLYRFRCNISNCTDTFMRGSVCGKITGIIGFLKNNLR